MPSRSSAGLNALLGAGGLNKAIFGLGEVGAGLPLVNWLRRNYPGLTRSEAGTLARMAREYAGAGSALNSGPPNAKGLIKNIPINPFLYGGNNLGRRFQYQVTVQLRDRATGLTGYVTQMIDSAVLLTQADLLAIASAGAMSRLGDDYMKRRFLGAADTEVAYLEIRGIVRAF
jgi:hypothetical protein